MLVTLKRQATANTPAAGYTVRFWQWSTSERRVYQDAIQAAIPGTDTELAVDDEVPGASFCLGTTRREVRYAGNGTVYTTEVLSSPACASSMTDLAVSQSGLTKIDQADGYLTANWSGGVGPFTVRCGLLEPGRDDVQAYYFEAVTTANNYQFPPTNPGTIFSPAPSLGPRQQYTTLINPGLGPGRYRVEVTEQLTGLTLSEDVILDPHQPGNTELFILNEQTFLTVSVTVPAGNTLLAVQIKHVTEEDTDFTTIQFDATLGRPVTTVERITADDLPIFIPVPEVGDLTYLLPAGVEVAPGIVSDGQRGVYTRLDPRPARLAVANLILFHPDKPLNATGGVLVELDQDQDPAASLTTFTLYDPTDTPVAVNLTGRFDNLLAGAYRVNLTPAFGAQQDIRFTLEARYGLRWYLDFTDLINNRPCRLELWAKKYTGEAAEICGQADVVTLDTQAIEGGPLQADMPDAAGTSLEVRLLTEPGALADLFLEDRALRADLYYAEVLLFRGYLQPDIYTEPLLSGKQPINFTATCGLAGLKDTDFAGHVGQELRGRRRLLDTLLHCLSRTDVCLPVHIYTNRKALELLTDETPETTLYTDRLAYLTDKGEPESCRTVVDAICQLLGGTIVQRNGHWEIRSVMEADREAAGRIYFPAGTLSGTTTTTVPAATIKPPTLVDPDQGDWHWIGGDQTMSRRAGWKSLEATADATFAKNAFRQGDYFSEAFIWNPAGNALQASAGWAVGAATPGARVFPLSLAQSGKKAEELAALWPEAAAGSNYLESEPAPLANAREGLPLRLSLTAKFVHLGAYEAAPNDKVAALVLLEIVAERLTGGLFSMGHVFSIPRSLESGGYTTLTADIPFSLPSGVIRPRIRLHPYRTRPTLRARVGGGNGHALLVQSVGIALLPQGAEWEAETTFKALGPGGTVTPSDPLEVFHVDVPALAGIYEGNAYAFRRVVSRGLSGPTTLWARPVDEKPAPLLANAVLDVLALRGNPSRVLTGTVRHRTQAEPTMPEILDAVDAPYDIDGRRWAVGARRWNVCDATTEITLLEIGEGAWLDPPVYELPDELRLTEGAAIHPLTGEVFPTYRILEDGAPRLLETE